MLIAGVVCEQYVDYANEESAWFLRFGVPWELVLVSILKEVSPSLTVELLLRI